MQIILSFSVLCLFASVSGAVTKNSEQNLKNELALNFNKLMSANSRPVKLAAAPLANTDTSNWLRNTFYQGSGCSGSVMTTQYIATGFCFPDGGAYATYSCDSTAITLTRYSDDTCTTQIGQPATNQPPINYCFAADTDDDGYINADTGEWDSNMYTCSTGYPQNTLPAAAVSRTVFDGTGCDNTNMIAAQFGLQELCYTNYNGTYYSSFMYSDPYRFEYSGPNCDPANTMETIYLPLATCSDSDDGGSVSYATYGTVDTNGGSNDDNNVSKDKLIIGIVISFVGGVILTALGVFLWLKFAKSPLSSKTDNINNI